MPPQVARTAKGGQDARTGGPIDGTDVPILVTPLVTMTRGHPDDGRLAGEPIGAMHRSSINNGYIRWS